MGTLPKPSSLHEHIGARYSRPKAELLSKYVNNLFDVGNKKVLDYLIQERKLDLETVKYFKIGCNERGDVAIPVFKDGILIDFKFRSIKEKHLYRVPESETWIVNENALTLAKESRKLVITEGEIDAFSAWQLGVHAVISGTGGAGEVGRAMWIDNIPDDAVVYIIYDSDAVGQKAARQLADRIGIERCYNVQLTEHKDMNEFLQKGGTSEDLGKILKEAPRFGVDGVSRISDVIDQLRANPVVKKPIFMERFNAHTKGGIVRKSMVMISGRYGTGKSAFLLNMLIDQADRGEPVLLISLENDMMLTLQRILSIKFNTPIERFTDKMWDKAKKDLLDYPFYLDMSMESYSGDKVRRISEQAKKLYGIEWVGYDHLHWSVERTKPEELEKISKEFLMIAHEKDLIMLVVCHVRKADKEQKVITGEDLKGSIGMAQLANQIMILQNFGSGMELNLEKSRESRSHLRFPLNFEGETGVMTEDMERKIKHFDEEVEDADSGDKLVVPQFIDRTPTKTIKPDNEIDGY